MNELTHDSPFVKVMTQAVAGLENREFARFILEMLVSEITGEGEVINPIDTMYFLMSAVSIYEDLTDGIMFGKRVGEMGK